VNNRFENIKEDISEALELPKDIILDLPRITLIGHKQIHIENHKGIIEYSTEKIRIKYKEGSLKVIGNNLNLRSIISEEIIIKGNIFSIEFGNRGV